MTKTFTLATISRSTPRLEYVGSLFAVRTHPGAKRVILWPTTYLHFGREEVAREFMGLGSEVAGDWLFFIDDDTQFSPDAVDAILDFADADTRPIVGGVYWSPTSGTLDPTNDVFPVVFNLESGERGSQFQDTFVHRPMPRGWVAAQTEPFECDAIGTGFLAIHRSVLAKMTEHYPPPLHWFTQDCINNVAAGEDLNFCHRAKLIGFPVWAVPLSAAQIQHIKSVRISRPNPENLNA